jgi:hypothetical protein
MLTQNDRQADQQLLEQRTHNEEVQAWAPSPSDPPGREWNGQQLPSKRRDGRRRSFASRHPIAVALGVPLVLLTGAGGYLYLDHASHFETT